MHEHHVQSYILKLHGVCPSVCPSRCQSWFQDLDGRIGPGLEIEVPKVTWCLSVHPAADLGFRISTDGQDQVLKSRSLDGRGGGGRRRGGGSGGWSGVATGCPHSTGPGLEIEVPRWKRRRTTTNGGGAGWLEWRSHGLPSFVGIESSWIGHQMWWCTNGHNVLCTIVYLSFATVVWNSKKISFPSV